MDLVVQFVLTCAAFGAVFFLVVAIGGTAEDTSRRLITRREDEAAANLHGLFIQNITPRQVVAMSAGGALVTALIVQFLTNNIVLTAISGGAMTLAPRAVFAYLRAARIQRFQEQLPDGLALLGSSSRAGLSLSQAIQEVANSSKAPLSEEFGLIAHEQQLGLDLGKAIDNARERMNSRTFNLVATALIVNREKGGNLPEALDTMSRSLKEIWRLEQRIITASAEGRKAVRLISGLPVGIFILVSLLQPDLPKTLTTDFAGQIILLIAILFYAGGLWWLLRVLRIDV